MAITTFKGTVPVEDWDELNIPQQPKSDVAGLALRAKEREEVKQEKAKADYLRMAEIDPIFSVSTYWQQKQAEKIQEFQNDLTDIYYKSKNKPKLQDLMEVQTKKQALAMWQGKILQGNQQYQQVIKEIQNDPYGQKYDINHANKRISDWINGATNGEFPSDVLLPPRVGDLRGYYEGLNWTGDEIRTKTLKNGQLIEETVPMSDEGLKSRVKNHLFTNPKLMRTVTEDFAALPPEEKKKWLTQYGDDAVSEWDYQNHGKYAFKQRKNVSPYLGRGRTGSGTTTPKYPETLAEVSNFEQRQIKLGTGDKAYIQKFGDPIFLTKDINNRRISAKPYYDLSTGDYINKDIQGDVNVSDIGIEYLPVKNGILVPNETYKKGDGLADGVEIKPFAVGMIKNYRGEDKSVAYPYTKEWDDFIKANSKQEYNIEPDKTYKYKTKKELKKVSTKFDKYKR